MRFLRSVLVNIFQKSILLALEYKYMTKKQYFTANIAQTECILINMNEYRTRMLLLHKLILLHIIVFNKNTVLVYPLFKKVTLKHTPFIQPIRITTIYFYCFDKHN